MNKIKIAYPSTNQRSIFNPLFFCNVENWILKGEKLFCILYKLNIKIYINIRLLNNKLFQIVIFRKASFFIIKMVLA